MNASSFSAPTPPAIDVVERARSYHAVRFPYDPRRARVWREVVAYLERFLPSDGAFLELGAGYGECSRFLRARQKYALDLNPELARYWAPDVEPLIQSALDPWPLEDGSLDAIVASNFFEHFTLPEGELLLAEAARALKPEGRLVVIQPNFRLEPRRYFDDYTHKAIYTDVGFADFVEARGWRLVRREARFLPFSMKSRLPTASWLVRLYLALPWRPLAGQFLVVAGRPKQS